MFFASPIISCTCTCFVGADVVADHAAVHFMLKLSIPDDFPLKINRLNAVPSALYPPIINSFQFPNERTAAVIDLLSLNTFNYCACLFLIALNITQMVLCNFKSYQLHINLEHLQSLTVFFGSFL